MSRLCRSMPMGGGRRNVHCPGFSLCRRGEVEGMSTPPRFPSISGNWRASLNSEEISGHLEVYGPVYSSMGRFVV